MRQGVIEIELKAVRVAPPECDREPVEIGFARVHPHGHRAALLGKKRVASGNTQALAGNVFARDAVGRMKAIQEAASEDAVNAIEIVRGRAAGEVSILVSRPDIIDKRQIRNQAGIVHDLLGHKGRGIVVRQPGALSPGSWPGCRQSARFAAR